MRSLVIDIDKRCNANCVHCCLGCTPDAKEYISDDEIDMIINYAEKCPELKRVSITGGEPLLRKNKVIETINRVSKLGKDTTLITNGFWAKDKKQTDEILLRLYQSGLKALTVSYDEYHAKYIPYDCIRNLFEEVKKYPISVANKFT